MLTVQRFGTALGLVLIACAGALADVPAVQISCGTAGSEPLVWYPPGTDNGNGSYTYSGDYYAPDWGLDYDLLAKDDPFVNAVYGLTNNSNITQTFILTVLLPVSPPITPSSLMGGSTGGSINDANFDGVGTLTTAGPGTSFYLGLIDLGGALPIYPDFFSVSVPFQGGTANIPAVAVGLPGPTQVGPPVISSIGIQHMFTLTPGDTVAITSLFVVTPEPTSCMLLGLGALALCRRR
jgi:hypothetical protein